MDAVVAIDGRSTGTVPQPATSRGVAARFAWLIAAIGVLDIGLLCWVYLSDPSASEFDLISGVSLLVSLLAFVIAGAVIVSRRPGNVIGWLLMIPGLSVPLSEIGSRWLVGLDPPPTAVGPGLWLVLWATGFAWVALIFPLFHILLTLPTGRLLSPRWRLAVVLEVAMIATMAFMSAFSESMGPFVNDAAIWTVPNPVGFLPEDSMDGVVGVVWQLGLLALCVLGGAAIALRFRRGTRDERQQLEWPVAGGLVFGATYAATAIDSTAVGALFAVGITAIPVSVAIAITRYRLYDIDRIISRTVSYGLITAVLAAAFLATNLALQTVLHRGSTFEVAVSTLVVAMLFQPLRTAIQRPIDRRFNRARVDSERMVAAFAARARDQMDLPMLATELAVTAGRAVQPSSAAIWIRGGVRGLDLGREGAG
jgi:hypothetical protein